LHKLKRPIGGVLTGIAGVLIFVSVFSFIITSATGKPKDGKTDKEIYQYHDLFLSIYDKIVNFYVEETNKRILIEGAIKGMLSTLDKNNYYITGDDREKDISPQIHFNLFGLIMGIKNDKLQVIDTLPGSPAELPGFFPETGSGLSGIP